MTAYYNEYDPFAAAWLRELIKAGHIAPGYVDERSILEVDPVELATFTQCHFFAGIGVWSYALRRAGWSDDRPVWTGSPPCQPFSSAGKQLGTADERHLWPAFFNLIKERGPQHVFGEQVAAAIGQGWFDALQSDLEAENYATGMVVLPACGVGAPHIRQRLWFVAEWMADATISGIRAFDRKYGSGFRQEKPDRGCRSFGRMADSSGEGLEERVSDTGIQRGARRTSEGQAAELRGDAAGPGPTNSFWGDADWLGCRDGKWRPVEPGTFPLAHGAPTRVGRLRGYGNAINAEAARAFIETYMSLDT